MRDPAFRKRLLDESPDPGLARIARRVMAFERIFPLGDPPDYEPPQERSIASLARRQELSPVEHEQKWPRELRDELAQLHAGLADYAGALARLAGVDG